MYKHLLGALSRARFHEDRREDMYNVNTRIDINHKINHTLMYIYKCIRKRDTHTQTKQYVEKNNVSVRTCLLVVLADVGLVVEHARRPHVLRRADRALLCMDDGCMRVVLCGD